MIKRLFSLLLFLQGFSLRSQPPDTELWLFKIEQSKLKTAVLTASLNITKRSGYDNQPSFSNDDKRIYYVSIRDSTKQADIYYYDLKSKKNIQVTKTPVSEYSPVMTSDDKFITSVVVEPDSAQRIHFIDRIKSNDTLRFEFDSVGYYTFLNPDTVIYYKLTSPHSLRYFVKGGKESKWLGNAPIRTFRAINRHTLLYGLKDSSKVTFYKYDFLLHKAMPYAEYPSLSEDVFWHPQYGLVKSEGAQLIRFDEAKKEWLPLFDLSSFGIKKITRFTFDSKNKYLVVVDNL